MNKRLPLDSVLALLRESPLVASVQASEGSPLQDPGTLVRLAQASLSHGVRLLRLEGAASIAAVRQATGAPCIGLIKRRYPGSDVYITPTLAEVQELLSLGCEIIALDGTRRPRPGGESFADLVAAIHEGGALAMADCDTPESGQACKAAGADLFGTTLAGYTDARSATHGPDLDLVRRLPHPALAEGRYSQPWQAQAALRAGAAGVVIGGALNDPVKQTLAFTSAVAVYPGPVGAVDIGGTWLRFALVDPGMKIVHREQVPLPQNPVERLGWIQERCREHGVTRLGVSSGGTVDPRTKTVIEAKAIVPGHVGSRFEFDGLETVALNDGLATVWGQAMTPEGAGKRIACLALGTGVGLGLVDRGEILMGPHGEYPRLNDIPCPLGPSLEEFLGGAAQMPVEVLMEMAEFAVRTVRELYRPDVIFLAGGVGLAVASESWDEVRRAVYEVDAGLMGAAWMAKVPPMPGLV